tara:strand:- start:2371 stop:3687 length:1317 start_codon:yes stop_codon:yes gene_type:complete
MAKQRLEQKQYQTLSPQQIQFLDLLQIPVVSLEKRVEKELEENPSLEEDVVEESAPYQGYIYNTRNAEHAQIEDASESLEENLIKQLIDLNLNDKDLFLVKYLINSLDDNGFLSRDLYSISSDLLVNNNLKATETELQDALKTLQSLEPCGVGAKNLQNCLLIQLKRLHPEEKIAQEIILEYYTQFSNKNFELLIKSLNISQKKLKSIYALVQRLTPIPSTGFSKNTNVSQYIYPDFTITYSNNELRLQLNRGGAKKLKINNYYSNLLLETADKKTKDFLQKKIEKARWFKDSMKKREGTLRLVMEAIIELQNDFFISGAENDLKPMKLADVAEVVNMDISTISRVSNAKFIETHFGTFKVKELFSDAYRKDNGKLISTKEIKSGLQKLILNEDKSDPFTDERLAELLGKEDYHISRRTVSKYREQLGVEKAKLRREL